MEHAPVASVVAEHAANAAELLSALRTAPAEHRDRVYFDGLSDRADAHVDALRIAGPGALDLLRRDLADDPSAASVLALLLAEIDPAHAAPSDEIGALLAHDEWSVREAAWWGIRLAGPDHLGAHLRPLIARATWDFAAAAAADALAFHRLDFQAERRPWQPGEEEPVAWLLAEACGRVQAGWGAVQLPELLRHPAERVRAAALRAAARCGYKPLLAWCRAAADQTGDAAASEFLGVVGSADDVPRLQHAATQADTADAALRGLGRLGLTAALPSLLYFLDAPEVAEEAAAAITRITGTAVPRGAPPDAPNGMSEDDLDVWEPVAPVDVRGARAWWAAAADRFDPAKRWQAGLCVSDDPLGPTFDALPLPVRHDVYLRERALSRGAPDWELDTWTWRQRAPAGP